VEKAIIRRRDRTAEEIRKGDEFSGLSLGLVRFFEFSRPYL
jgi:hypothetical protein